MTTLARYERPAPSEHAPYYGQYIDQVAQGDLLEVLRSQIGEYESLFGGLPEARGDHAYAAGKWTLKEVLGHVIDAERVFAYRALTFGRNDQSALPSFDENAWIGPAEFRSRTLADLVEEFTAVRASSVALFEHFPDAAISRIGTASGKLISVRALGYIIAGHAHHHAKVIRERYL